MGLTRELTFNDGKTVHEVLIVNHPQLYRLSYSMSDPTPSRGTTIFAPSSCNRWALAILFSLHRLFPPQRSDQAEVQGMLRDFYHAVFAGVGRVLNVNFTIQQ